MSRIARDDKGRFVRSSDGLSESVQIVESDTSTPKIQEPNSTSQPRSMQEKMLYTQLATFATEIHAKLKKLFLSLVKNESRVQDLQFHATNGTYPRYYHYKANIIGPEVYKSAEFIEELRSIKKDLYKNMVNLDLKFSKSIVEGTKTEIKNVKEEWSDKLKVIASNMAQNGCKNYSAKIRHDDSLFAKQVVDLEENVRQSFTLDRIDKHVRNQKKNEKNAEQQVTSALKADTNSNLQKQLQALTEKIQKLEKKGNENGKPSKPKNGGAESRNATTNKNKSRPPKKSRRKEKGKESAPEEKETAPVSASGSASRN